MDKISKLIMLWLILLAFCAISRPVEAKTSVYVFNLDQSSVVKTGGFAGVHETYIVTGQFQLAVDSDAGIASFEIVDANLTDETGAEYGRSLEEIFNMTGLAGTVIDETTIDFNGKTADGTESDVRLKLSFSNDSAHLTGNTTPPPNSADMFFYDVNAVAARKYAGGTGEPNNPYQIATVEDLITLGKTPEDYDKHFILTADIDLDPNLPGRKVFDRAVIAPANAVIDLNPEEDSIYFTGVFDGNGHTISNLTITGGSYLGLFGQVAFGAELKNLGVMDVNLKGSQGSRLIGGLVGSNSGTLTQCNSTGEVSGGHVLGGLVGSNNGGNITMSYGTGNVSGDENIGGLVGINDGGNIVMSYSTSTVVGDDAAVGGLVGQNVSGSILDCYSIGDVRGIEWIGGLVGWNNSESSISDCYSAGDVSGNWEMGGLVGENSGIITMSYSTSVVSGNTRVGGLVGSNSCVNTCGEITHSYWDIETSSELNMCGLQEEGASGCDPNCGKTTVEMQTASTFLDAGWDFVGETENGTEDTWSICEKTNYPRFVWQIPLGDFVCPDGVTIEDFVFFMEHWLDSNCDQDNGYCEGTDLNQSGTVDVFDLEIFFENWPDKN